MNIFYSEFKTVKKLLNLCSEPINLPKNSNEYGEFPNSDIKKIADSVRKSTNSYKTGLSLMISGTCFLVALLSFMFVVFSLGNVIYVILGAVAIFMLLIGYIPMAYLMSSDVKWFLSEANKKIVLTDSEMIYSVISLNETAGNKAKKYYEYHIPYENIVGIGYDESISRYSIKCNRYTLRICDNYVEKSTTSSKYILEIDDVCKFTETTKINENILIWDTFEKYTLFLQIADKTQLKIAPDDTIRQKHSVSYRFLLTLSLICTFFWLFAGVLLIFLIY